MSQVSEVDQMNLSDFVDSHAAQESVVPLDSVGPHAVEVHTRTGSEAFTRPLVAGVFWQSYLNSDAFVRDLRHQQVEQIPRGYEPLIVSHGDHPYRYSLLMFSDEARRTVSFIAEASTADLSDGWKRANARRRDSLNALRRRFVDPQQIQDALALTLEVAVEAYKAQRFCVVMAPPVEEELTSLPSPAIEIDAGGSLATCGALARDAIGRLGVTTAAHAIPAVASVTLAGYDAPVLDRVDEIQYDCCFVEWPVFAGLPPHRASHGPLKKAPRMNHEATFYQLRSPSPKATRVRAFNPELPYIDPNLQQTVRTDLVTARGDSGTALLDEDDYILGFAYARSAATAQLTYSSWIWADAVFQRLGLTAY